MRGGAARHLCLLGRLERDPPPPAGRLGNRGLLHGWCWRRLCRRYLGVLHLTRDSICVRVQGSPVSVAVCEWLHAHPTVYVRCPRAYGGFNVYAFDPSLSLAPKTRCAVRAPSKAAWYVRLRKLRSFGVVDDGSDQRTWNISRAGRGRVAARLRRYGRAKSMRSDDRAWRALPSSQMQPYSHRWDDCFRLFFPCMAPDMAPCVGRVGPSSLDFSGHVARSALLANGQ